MSFATFSGRPNNGTPHQVATISNTVQTLESAGVTLHAETRLVRVVVELADVRLVQHGATDPDPATKFGEVLYEGEAALISRAQADTIKWRRNDATDAKLQISQFLE